MAPLYQDAWYRFRFADDRIIPRFHLEGIEAGRRVAVFKIEPQSGERLGLLATGMLIVGLMKQSASLEPAVESECPT